MRAFAVPVLAFAALLACTLAAATAAAHEASSSAAKTPGAKRATARAYGREGDARRVKRVIHVDMSDTMRFFPSELRVKRGETVRFVVRNSGELPHQLVLGTMDELKKRAELMRKNPEMEHAHTQPNAVRAEPGASTRLVWQFTKPGEFHYACLVPGHFEAGMIGTIIVR